MPTVMFIDHFSSFDPSFKKVSMAPDHYSGVHGPGPYQLLEQAVHDISYFLHEMKLLTGDRRLIKHLHDRPIPFW